MVKKLVLAIVAVLAVFTALGYALFRPLPNEPEPADFSCYDLGQGAYVPLGVPDQAFGIGLSYAAHIRETASSFEPEQAPPVFIKSPGAIVRNGAEVRYPASDTLIAVADAFEPGLGEPLREDFAELSPLLDYEVEMGFVLLQDIDPTELDDPDFAPRLAFFIANDLSSRTIAILGEGQANRYEYWGISKSFPGFMPIADKAFAPAEALANGIPCVELETTVDGEQRQQQSTRDLIYTPKQMLQFVHAHFPDEPLRKGLIVLTGTPGGVAMTTPRWLVRLADLLRLSRFRRLSSKLDGETERFLKPGDRVTVRGQGLGKVSVTIVP